MTGVTVPLHKMPLCDCASKGAFCQGRKPGFACQAHDKWYARPCDSGQCPGMLHPDCCRKPIIEDEDEEE